MASLTVLTTLRHLRELGTNATCRDLRAFLSSLDQEVCSELFSATILNPVQNSIMQCDTDSVAVFFEFGASPAQFGASEAASSSPISMALASAARNLCLPILKLVIDEARARGCLEAAMAFTFDHDEHRWKYSVLNMCEADFAPALSLLFDAGLNAVEHRPRICEFIAHHAAASGATACLRRLQAHLPEHAWQAALSHRNAGVFATPLGDAFSHQRSETFDYLLSFHSAGGANGPDLLPRAVAEPALQSLVAWLARPGQTHEESLAEATRMFCTWDVPTRAETCLVLRHAAKKHPQVSAAQRGHLRAAAALAGCGLMPVQGTFKEAVGDATLSAPAADALLTLFTDTAAAQAHTQNLGSSVNSAKIRSDLAYDTDLICRLFRSGAGAAARLLMAEANALGGSRFTASQRSLLLAAVPAPNVVKPSEWVLDVRACLAPISGASPELAESLSVGARELAVALSANQPAVAQLYLDHGADVFERRAVSGRSYTLGVTELVATAMLGSAETHLRPAQASALPAGADHALALRSNVEFASLSQAEVRAHAAAAAEEEERILAALLQDPDFLSLDRVRSVAVWTWARAMYPAVSLRWLWARMCERDAARAGECLAFPGVSETLLDAAISAQNARCVRFLASCGARLSVKSARKLMSLGCEGKYELVWAMLDALPDDADERAALLNGDGTFALAGALLAPLRGLYFSEPLAGALLAAGAQFPPASIHRLSCAPGDRVQLPGESLRALHWALEKRSRC